MSQCANGTSRSFSFGRLSLAVPTRVMGSKSHASPDCPKKFSIVPKKFWRIWRLPAARQHKLNPVRKDQRDRCPKRRSHSWICSEIKDSEAPLATETSVRANAFFRALGHSWEPHWRAMRNHIAPAGVETPEAGVTGQL